MQKWTEMLRLAMASIVKEMLTRTWRTRPATRRRRMMAIAAALSHKIRVGTSEMSPMSHSVRWVGEILAAQEAANSDSQVERADAVWRTLRPQRRRPAGLREAGCSVVQVAGEACVGVALKWVRCAVLVGNVDVACAVEVA